MGGTPLRPSMASSCWAALALLLLGMLSQQAMAEFSICKTAPPGAYIGKPNATIWGQETMIAFGSGFRASQGALPGVEGPWVAPLITGAVLFIMTALLVYQAPPDAELHYWLVTLYPAATGIVEFTRVNFDASRFGFLTASWHNLPEYGLIIFNFADKRTATGLFRYVLLWVWLLDNLIMFIPSLDHVRTGVFWAGLFEQLTGICCDHLLCYTFAYLWYTAPHNSRLKNAYWYGLLGSIFHMLEIVPLVILLVGVVSRPYIPICIIVAVTTPITFYFYSKFATAWSVDAREETDAKLAIGAGPHRTLLYLGIGLGLFNILAPSLLIPSCKVQEASPLGRPIASPLISVLTTTPSSAYATKAEFAPYEAGSHTAYHLHPSDPHFVECRDYPNHPSCAPRDPTAPAGSSNTSSSSGAPGSCATTPGGGGAGPCAAGGASELYCPSTHVLTGTTTLVAKTGQGQDLLEMVATMPGPILKEEGAVSYNIGYYPTTGTIKFMETWSNVRTLLKHVYMSPTVRGVFGSADFQSKKRTQDLEGPFQTLRPCSEVSQEVPAMNLHFATLIDAPVELLWEKIGNWQNDCSWIPGALGITPFGEYLRIVHFANFNLTEIRSPPPLPAVPQPEVGHRLAYYLLDGYVIPKQAEVYRGEITLTPTGPAQTLYSYHITLTPKDASQADALYQQMTDTYTTKLMPALRAWGKTLKFDVPGTTEHFYQIKLAKDAPLKFPGATAAEVVQYLSGAKAGVQGPKVKYAGFIPKYATYLHKPEHLSNPDMSEPWDVVLGLEFPPDSAVSPEDFARGVARDVWSVQVKSKVMPVAADAVACTDEIVDATLPATANMTAGQVAYLANVARLSRTDAGWGAPTSIEGPESGINLNKYVDGYGAACYHRYMRLAVEILHPEYCHLSYYAEVVHHPDIPAEEQWDEILIPVYSTGWNMLKALSAPQYPRDLSIRAASLHDVVLYALVALPGSLISMD